MDPTRGGLRGARALDGAHLSPNPRMPGIAETEQDAHRALFQNVASNVASRNNLSHGRRVVRGSALLERRRVRFGTWNCTQHPRIGLHIPSARFPARDGQCSDPPAQLRDCFGMPRAIWHPRLVATRHGSRVSLARSSPVATLRAPGVGQRGTGAGAHPGRGSRLPSERLRHRAPDRVARTGRHRPCHPEPRPRGAYSMRVWSVIQFTSQVFPPSSEKACSKCADVRVMPDQT